MVLQDLTGKRFGSLVVIGRAPTVKKRTMWECKCDCGKRVFKEAYSLKTGETKSCGCLRRDSASINSRTHGMTKTALYKKFRGMVYRCENKRSKSYKDYGGRGIKVCPEWRHDYMNFYEWSMANGYRKGLTIERIDNDGDYSPENCRWATKIEQDNNRRTNHFITYNAETHTIAEWSRISGITPSAIYGRLKNGWSIERTLTEPLRRWS